MPAHAKPTPAKTCEWCGTTYTRKRVGKNSELECVSNYLRRRFCSRSCSVYSQHASPAPTEAASRKRAAAFIGPSCTACDSTVDLVVHHVSGDPMDNSMSNLQTLCRPCHGFFHAMLERTGRLPLAPMGRLVV